MIILSGFNYRKIIIHFIIYVLQALFDQLNKSVTIMFVRNQVLRGARGIAGLRNASCLVIAEHDTKSITQGTLAAVTAGSKIGDVSLLVFGSGIDNVAKSATTIKGVSKVISVENAVSNVNFVLNNSKYFLFYL